MFVLFDWREAASWRHVSINWTDIRRPKKSSEPIKLEATEGAPFSIPCDDSRSLPPARFSWKLKKDTADRGEEVQLDARVSVDGGRYVMAHFHCTRWTRVRTRTPIPILHRSKVVQIRVRLCIMWTCSAWDNVAIGFGIQIRVWTWARPRQCRLAIAQNEWLPRASNDGPSYFVYYHPPIKKS